MKKFKLLSLSFAVLIFTFTCTYVSYAYPGIVVNGTNIDFNDETGYPFVDSSSRTQVPLRAAMEAIGCSVDWDESSYSVNISKDNVYVNVPVNKNYIVKNGLTIQNDTSAQIINSRTYLPIRAVYEAFGAYVSWDDSSACVSVDTSSPLMQVHFIDVGQGDCAIIDFGSYEVLIDTGDKAYGKTVVENIRPYVDGALDLIIATHPDSDHIGGMPDVLSAYKVNKIIDSGYVSTTNAYTSYINSVKNYGCIFETDSDTKIEIGNGSYINIIETGDYWNNSNNMSVVAELVYGNTKVLFTGDINHEVENSVYWKFSDIDVLKVAHHGSSTSTSQSFLDIVKPEYAVISAGIDNRYGHPSFDALTRLINSSVRVLGTFKSGNITLNINSNKYSFNKASYLSLNDAGKKKNIANTAGDSYNENNSVNTNQQNNITYSYIGNKNTKKLHLSSCSYAQKMSEANKTRFSSREEALNNGYVPCKICNP